MMFRAHPDANFIDGLRDRAFWLVRSVARSMGLNLSQEMAAGRLGRVGYCAMIDTCIRSNCLGQCANWLGQHGGEAGAPPPHCANAQTLNKLLHRDA